MITVFGSKVGEEELNEIRTSIEAQWLGIGPKTEAFEKAFAKRLGLSDFALVDSGSNGLYVAVRLLNLPPKSEVIVPSFTWIACGHAIVLAGHTPVFCDVDLNTQNVTRETIAPHLSSKTKAIMVVHYAGKPVQMKPILDFGLPVIEDAAHAVDSKLDGKPCGSIGTIGVYSFDAVKNLTLGDGGGITAHDPALVVRTRLMRYCGIGKSGFEVAASKHRWWEYNIADFFPRFLPNDIMASIGLAQLRKLDVLQRYRKQIWDVYQKEFRVLEWLVRPEEPALNEQHSYFTYFVRILDGKRDEFSKYLYSKGIYSTLRYHPLHLNAIYQSRAKLPVCEQLNEEGLNLPLHPGLSSSDLDQVISAVTSFSKVLR